MGNDNTDEGRQDAFMAGIQMKVCRQVLKVLTGIEETDDI